MYPFNRRCRTSFIIKRTNKKYGDNKSFEFNESPVKQLFDIIYKKYEKSKFVDVDSGQRDFFKHKDTYKVFSESIPSYLKREIEYLFED